MACFQSALIVNGICSDAEFSAISLHHVGIADLFPDICFRWAYGLHTDPFLCPALSLGKQNIGDPGLVLQSAPAFPYRQAST